MSYHEIEVLQSYNLKCRNCGYTGWARTASIAEQQVVDHINMESVDGTIPNDEHHIEITPVTLIGRSI